MRPLVAAAAILLALSVADAKSPPTETTTVEGEVPAELPGRWLVVEQSRLKTGLAPPFARLWEIRRGANGLEVTVARVRLPETVSRPLAEAGRARRGWLPDDETLRRTAERWDELPASDTDVQAIEHHVAGDASGGNAFTITTEERFSGTRPLTHARAAYTVQKWIPERFAGTFARLAEVATPEPTSITLNGTFLALRLPDVPPRSPLRRVVDALLGRDEPP
jgi:hypothetical protein